MSQVRSRSNSDLVQSEPGSVQNKIFTGRWCRMLLNRLAQLGKRTEHEEASWSTQWCNKIKWVFSVSLLLPLASRFSMGLLMLFLREIWQPLPLRWAGLRRKREGTNGSLSKIISVRTVNLWTGLERAACVCKQRLQNIHCLKRVHTEKGTSQMGSQNSQKPPTKGSALCPLLTDEA